MPKQSLASIAKSVRTAMKKHSPEILTGIGIAGMITTTVMAVKATPKALILLEEKKMSWIRTDLSRRISSRRLGLVIFRQPL